MSGPYFIGKHGVHYRFEDIAKDIAERFPAQRGEHIFVQLDILGLRDEFDGGESPHGLPYSFSDYEPRRLPL